MPNQAVSKPCFVVYFVSSPLEIVQPNSPPRAVKRTLKTIQLYFVHFNRGSCPGELRPIIYIHPSQSQFRGSVYLSVIQRAMPAGALASIRDTQAGQVNEQRVTNTDSG